MNAIRTLGYRKCMISAESAEVLGADALILPGVGAFDGCVRRLRERGLDSVLNEAVLARKTQILGICVGMQLMATISEENGIHKGLNWIEGRVTKLDVPNTFAVPHVGWNDVQQQGEHVLFLERPIP